MIQPTFKFNIIAFYIYVQNLELKLYYLFVKSDTITYAIISVKDILMKVVSFYEIY